ncbi:MAG: hypothetical protein JSS69_13625 [Acidobacteria bacterium]|nr:hypothetical protein [Acidobacteriota bacterium]MBS1866949.1 hypothetical protein [Acidobacteriota bacterium]
MTNPLDSSLETGSTANSRSISRLARLAHTESARFIALGILFSFAAFAFIRSFSMTDPDFGWHLKAGQWILTNHALPQTDPFSAYGAGKPWYDYSWLFDIFFAGLYKYFGLQGFALLEMAARVAIPAFLYRTAQRIGGNFWISAIAAGAATYSMWSIYAPRPGMFTIVFFALELEILFGALLSGTTRRLWFLPLLFWVWAGIHIEFVHGLIVLALFAGESVLNHLIRYKPLRAALPRKTLWVFAACALATLLTPYGWHLYATVIQYAGQTNIYEAIVEMLAVNFRQPFHYVFLFLALAAAMALGWSRQLRPLYLLLFAFAAVIGFRSIKDVWLLSTVSVALIAVSLRAPEFKIEAAKVLKPRHGLALALCVLAVLAVAWRRYDANNTWIEMGLAGRFPEAAAQYVEKHHLQGPLYNDFSAGGFLIWRLPSIPVSIDGRTNVHGDERVKVYSDMLRGFPGWEKNPELSSAKLIIWPTKSPLVGLLRCDARFQEVFSDPQATVFVHR